MNGLRKDCFNNHLESERNSRSPDTHAWVGASLGLPFWVCIHRAGSGLPRRDYLKAGEQGASGEDMEVLTVPWAEHPD